MNPQRLLRRPGAGFSLLDLLITMVIVAILATIALPTFSNTIRKSRRADAVQSLRAVQLAQERYRANNPTYGTTAQILGAATTSPGGWYTLAIVSPTGTTYTATATAISGTSQTADTQAGTSCSTLTVNQDASVGQAVCWGQ